MTGAAFEHMLQLGDQSLLETVMRNVVVFSSMKSHQKGQVMDLMGTKGLHQIVAGQQQHLPVSHPLQFLPTMVRPRLPFPTLLHALNHPCPPAPLALPLPSPPPPPPPVLLYPKAPSLWLLGLLLPLFCPTSPSTPPPPPSLHPQNATWSSLLPPLTLLTGSGAMYAELHSGTCSGKRRNALTHLRLWFEVQGLGKTTMYSGDRINDLVALASADVGVAVGAGDAAAAAVFSTKECSIGGKATRAHDNQRLLQNSKAGAVYGHW